MPCRGPGTGELIAGCASCRMGRGLIINAGIKRVVIRDTREDYRVVDVDQEWVEQDDSLPKQV